MAAADLRVNFQIGMYWLEIARVKFEDAGVYSCHARNSAGEAVANVTLTVQNYTETSLRQTMSKRSHTIKPKETGDTVTLECPNQANWTRVLWYQNDSMLVESEIGRRIVLADGLHIKDLTEQDSGFYVCEEAVTGEKVRRSRCRYRGSPLGQVAVAVVRNQIGTHGEWTAPPSMSVWRYWRLSSSG